MGEKGKVPCPICGAVGEERCFKGKKDTDRWKMAEYLDEMHDERLVANGYPSRKPPRRQPIPTPGSDSE